MKTTTCISDGSKTVIVTLQVVHHNQVSTTVVRIANQKSFWQL